jgi:hypothetical protein
VDGAGLRVHLECKNYRCNNIYSSGLRKTRRYCNDPLSGQTTEFVTIWLRRFFYTTPQLCVQHHNKFIYKIYFVPLHCLILESAVVRSNKGRAISQAVSCWLPIAAARVRARVWQVGFVVDKMALGQVFSEYFGFPCQSSFHQILHHHNRPRQVQ